MKKYFLPLLIILSGCSIQKRCEWNMKRAQQFGCLKMTSDTVIRYVPIKGDTVLVKIPVFADSSYIDSVINAVKGECIPKEVVKEIYRNIPCRIKPYHKDTTDYTLNITVNNGIMDVDLKIKPKVIPVQEITHGKETIQYTNHIPWYIKVLIVCLSAGLLGSVLLNLSNAFKKK